MPSLSIGESCSSQHSSTATSAPSPTPSDASNFPYVLSDLRRKLIKLYYQMRVSFTIDVATCNGGVEVLERILKEFDNGSLRSDGNLDVSQTDDQTAASTVDG